MAGRAQAALGSAHSFFQLAMPQCSAKPINESISNVVIGLVLVVVASLGICLALYVQKVVHLRSDPETGLERIHFTRVPLWWAGVLGNAVSELVNLAALGFAPATLVAPLGCLCVVFNALTAVFWLGEPFFKRDLAGLLLISLGVGIVVLSQVGLYSLIAPGFVASKLLKNLHTRLCRCPLQCQLLTLSTLDAHRRSGLPWNPSPSIASSM